MSKQKNLWPKAHRRSHFHLSLAIIAALSVAAGLLISIQTFDTEQAVFANTPITVYHQPKQPSPRPQKGTEGAFCGGIAPGAFPCNTGLVCKLDGNYPDAGGTCIRK